MLSPVRQTRRADLQNANSDPLKRLQERAGISNKKLAQLCGVHETTVSRWATGAVEPPAIVLAYLRQRINIAAITRKLEALIEE